MKNHLQSDNDSIEAQKRIITIPNILSFFRLCFIPLFVWLYCVKQQNIWTGAMLALSGLTDIVDGQIARKFHLINNFGKALDPVADKATQAAMLFCPGSQCKVAWKGSNQFPLYYDDLITYTIWQT